MPWVWRAWSKRSVGGRRERPAYDQPSGPERASIELASVELIVAVGSASDDKERSRQACLGVCGESRHRCQVGLTGADIGRMRVPLAEVAESVVLAADSGNDGSSASGGELVEGARVSRRGNLDGVGNPWASAGYDSYEHAAGFRWVGGAASALDRVQRIFGEPGAPAGVTAKAQLCPGGRRVDRVARGEHRSLHLGVRSGG